MPKVKGRGGNGPVKVAQDEDDEQTKKEEKETKEWFEKLVDRVKDIKFPFAQRYNEKQTKRVDLCIYPSLNEMARTIQQISKKVQFKNITEVFRLALYWGLHFLLAYLFNEDEEIVKKNPLLQREIFYIKDMEGMIIYDGIRNFADRQYEYAWKGIKTFAQVEEKIEEFLDNHVPKSCREEAQRIIKERVFDGKAKENLLAKNRQKKHRAEMQEIDYE